MTLDKSQRTIINSLLEKPQTIRQLIVSTGLSDTTIRQNLKIMVKMRELDADEARQPYLYSVSAESAEFRNRAAIDKAKDILRGVTEGTNPITKALAKVPKEQLIEWPPLLRAISEAIEELEADGELIDTLETR